MRLQLMTAAALVASDHVACCRCGSTPPILIWWPVGPLTTKSGCGMSAPGSASTTMTLVRRSAFFNLLGYLAAADHPAVDA